MLYLLVLRQWMSANKDLAGKGARSGCNAICATSTYFAALTHTHTKKNKKNKKLNGEMHRHVVICAQNLE